MSLRKIQRGRLELAGYILLPAVILVCIWVVERFYCTRMEQEIANRRLQLRFIPAMENRLQRARERMKSFTDAEDGSDSSSELTMRLNSGAQESGLSTRSVKLEKLPLPASGGWTDYRVVALGEGTLLAVTRFIDDAERIGTRPFRVIQARVTARSLSPDVVYDAEIEFLLRTLHCGEVGKAVDGGTVLRLNEQKIAETEARIDGLMQAILNRQRDQAGLLPLVKLKNRKSVYRSTQQAEMPFHLTGVVRDGKKPLVLTDQGLMGVGEERGGYRIIEIRDDSVVVERQPGSRIVMKLYGSGEK